MVSMRMTIIIVLLIICLGFLGGSGYYIYATILSAEERIAKVTREFKEIEDVAEILEKDEQPYLYLYSSSNVQPSQLMLYDEKNRKMLLEASDKDFGIEHQSQFRFLFPKDGTKLLKLEAKNVKADTLLTIVNGNGDKKFEKSVKNSENHRFINCNELTTLAQFPDSNNCPGDSDAAKYIDRLDPSLSGEDLDAAKVSVTYFIDNCNYWCNYDIRNPEASFTYTGSQIVYKAPESGEQCQTQFSNLMEEAKQRKEDICFTYE